jgi:hypothetical protein
MPAAHPPPPPTTPAGKLRFHLKAFSKRAARVARSLSFTNKGGSPRSRHLMGEDSGPSSPISSRAASITNMAAMAPPPVALL